MTEKINYLASFSTIKELTEEQIKEIWTNYDADGNGHIDSVELSKFLKELCELNGETWSSVYETELVPEMIKAWDTDGNGTIEFDEFKKSFTELIGQHSGDE